MASRRTTIQDFLAQINAQTPGSVTGATYQAALNADGSVKVTQVLKGVSTVLFSKVLWNTIPNVARTDLNISGDAVTVFFPEGTVGTMDAQIFINQFN